MAARKTTTSIQQYADWTTLGSGGMAKVYKARQENLERDVAIKELRPEFARDPGIVQRFEREARYSAKLKHESIVHIYDYVKEGASHYIVMEFVDGTDLGRILKQVGPLPPAMAAIFAVRIALGLEHAHKHGVIHRDVKPGNVLVSRNGEVKLSDFGIAKDPLNPSDNMTRTGQAVGTPSYMSPEQIVGDPIDFRTDQFAFGILLYELLTGEKPFKADTASSLLEKIRTQGYVDVRSAKSGIPRVLAKVVRRCLKKEPKKRFASTDEMRRLLEGWALRQIRISPEESVKDWLYKSGVFAADATKMVPLGTTNISTKSRPMRARLMMAGGAALFGVAAFAAVPMVWNGGGDLPLPSPDGPLASPTWSAAVEPSPAESSVAAESPVSSPTSRPLVTPNETPVPTPTAEPSPSPTPTAEPSPSPTATPTAEPTATATPAPTPTATAKPSATPKPTATATAKPSPTKTATPKPSPTKTPTPKPTPTKPKPSPTKTPKSN